MFHIIIVIYVVFTVSLYGLFSDEGGLDLKDGLFKGLTGVHGTDV